MNFFRHIPLAISGLALALASLGNLIAYHGGLFAEPASTYLRYGFGALALLALLLFIARIVTDPKGVREDVRSPVVLSVLPTSTMATIMLSLYLQPYAPAAAKVIWATAAVIQLCIMACFVKRFVLRFQLTNVYPSWFVAAVGIQAVAIASPYMDALVVGQAAFWLGFSLFFAVAVLVALRYAKHRPLPEKYRPTIMVLTAPMSICIFGYLSAVPTTSTTLLLCMLVLAAGSYLIALCSLPGLMRLPFYPAHSALGFPMVVSAFAFKRASEYLTSQGYVVWTTPVLVTELLAIVVVCYVLARYLRYLYGQLQQTGAAK